MNNQEETMKEEIGTVIDAMISRKQKIEILYLMFAAEYNLAKINGRIEILESLQEEKA